MQATQEAVDRVVEFLKANKLAVTWTDQPYEQFAAEWQDWSFESPGRAILFIGYYFERNGDLVPDPNLTLLLRDGSVESIRFHTSLGTEHEVGKDDPVCSSIILDVLEQAFCSPPSLTFDRGCSVIRQQLNRFYDPELALAGKALVTKYASAVVDIKPEGRCLRLGSHAVGYQEMSIHSQMFAAHLIEMHGFRMIQVSQNEAEIYKHVDLEAVPVKQWRQSYPIVMVWVRESLFAVFQTPHVPEVNILAYYHDRPDGKWYADHVFCNNNLEASFTVITPDSLSPSTLITPEVGRIVMNAVLHLANYPEMYARYSNKLMRILSKPASHQMKRQELIPQIIRLKHSLADPSTAANIGTSHGSHGGLRPHWRKGHWRSIAIGHGRTDRKYAFIAPVLVNAAFVAGSTSSVTVFQ